jgi:hypothetical protein
MAVFIDSSSRSGKSILQIHFHRINSGMRRRSGGTRDARTALTCREVPRRAVRVQRMPPRNPPPLHRFANGRRSGGTRDARTAHMPRHAPVGRYACNACRHGNRRTASIRE